MIRKGQRKIQAGFSTASRATGWSRWNRQGFREEKLKLRKHKETPQLGYGRTCVVMDSSACVCVYLSAAFHLLHPVLSAFAGILMPDVVSGVSESHSTHSVLHVHLPLIHLPGREICISYLCGMLKTLLGGGRLCRAVPYMSDPQKNKMLLIA